MRVLCGGRSTKARRRERGGARLNFLIVMVIICAAAYVGYQIIPVVYRAEAFETFMQDTVNNAAYTDKNAAWVEQQLKKSLAEYDVPSDAAVSSMINDSHIEARVQYTRAIPLAVTEYRYHFDKTVKSSSSVNGSR
jgi:type II secretory pathway component PulM